MYLMHNIFNEPNWFLRNQKPEKTKKTARKKFKNYEYSRRCRNEENSIAIKQDVYFFVLHSQYRLF